MAKKSKRSTVDALADVQVHRVLLHPVTLGFLAVFAILGGAVATWRANRHVLERQAEFQLTPERIQISPQPRWVQADIKQVAFDGSRLGELSLLDPDAAPRVAEAFSVQPWVANVSVRKRPTHVAVTLQFRQPVGLVEYGEQLLLPVDGEGIVLDGSDFNPAAAGDFLRITVSTPLTGSLVAGEAWPDDRVVAAALIAHLLQPHAQVWGIGRIKHIPLLPDSVVAGGDFELWTTRGTAGPRIIWGSPPGYEQAGERKPAEKLQVLAELFAKHGTFAEWPAERTLDLRSPSVKLLTVQPETETGPVPGYPRSPAATPVSP